MTRHAFTIDLGPLELYCSFDNVVGFGEKTLAENGRPEGPVTAYFAENIWTNTVGKHINGFRAKLRCATPPIAYDPFRTLLRGKMRSHGLSQPRVRFLGDDGKAGEL